MPNCAKLVFVFAGSDSKWKPCPVSFGVVAETAIVAEHSKKSPRNLFVASLNPRTLRVTPLHSIFIELMMALKSGLESHLLPCLDQTVFKIEDAQAGAQARFELLRIKGFGQVIVGPGFEAGDDVSL